MLWGGGGGVTDRWKGGGGHDRPLESGSLQKRAVGWRGGGGLQTVRRGGGGRDRHSGGGLTKKNSLISAPPLKSDVTTVQTIQNGHVGAVCKSYRDGGGGFPMVKMKSKNTLPPISGSENTNLIVVPPNFDPIYHFLTAPCRRARATKTR